MNMEPIILEFLTDDEKMRKLCQLYWKIDSANKSRFACSVEEIAEKFDLDKNVVYQIVAKNCKAYFQDSLCKKCNQPICYLKSRTTKSFSYGWPMITDLCPKCAEEHIQKEAEEKKKQERIQRERKIKQMSVAFQNGAYEQLNLVEFNFLVMLAKCKNWTLARKKFGISKENAKSMTEKFNELHLIDWDQEKEDYFFLPDIEEALNRFGQKRKGKSIFSPKSIELYRKLKRTYLFVYPEIPLCAFIEREQVEHLFTEAWQPKYFLNCRVDFLVCDPEGMPEFAIEYQGGYHKSTERKDKEEFKEAILNEVGLPLRKITSKDLKEEFN